MNGTSYDTDASSICKGKGLVEIVEVKEVKKWERKKSEVERPSSVLIKEVIQDDEKSAVIKVEEPKTQSNQASVEQTKIADDVVNDQPNEGIKPHELAVAAKAKEEDQPANGVLSDKASGEPVQKLNRQRTTSASSNKSGRTSPKPSLLIATLRRKTLNSSQLSLAASEMLSLDETNDDASSIVSQYKKGSRKELEEWYATVIKNHKRKAIKVQEGEQVPVAVPEDITVASLVGNDSQDPIEVVRRVTYTYLQLLGGITPEPDVKSNSTAVNRKKTDQPRQSAAVSMGNIPKSYLIPMPHERKPPASMIADYEDDGKTIQKMFSIMEADLVEHIFNPELKDAQGLDLFIACYRYYMDPKKLLDYIFSFLRCKPKPMMVETTPSQSPASPLSPASGKSSQSRYQEKEARRKREQEEKERQEFYAKKVPEIRSNAFKFLLKWIQTYWNDFASDTILLARVEKLAEELSSGIDSSVDGAEEDVMMYSLGIQLTEAIRQQQLTYAETGLRALQMLNTARKKKESTVSKLDDSPYEAMLENIRQVQAEQCFIYSQEPQRIAELLTLVEFEQIQKISNITLLELLRAVSSKEKKQIVFRPLLFPLKEACEQQSHILRPMLEYLNFSRTISDLVVTSILTVPTNVRERGILIKKWIKTAQTCHFLNNYATMAAIVAGLLEPSVFTLNQSWSQLKKKHMQMLRDMASLLDFDHPAPSGKFEALLAETRLVQPPVIPYLPAFLRELSRVYYSGADMEVQENHNGLTKTIRQLVNMEKFSNIYSLLSTLKLYRSLTYKAYAEQALKQEPVSRPGSSKSSTWKKLTTKSRQSSGTSIASSASVTPPKLPLEKTPEKKFALFGGHSRTASSNSLATEISTDGSGYLAVNGYIPLSTLQEIETKGDLRKVRDQLQLLQQSPAIKTDADELVNVMAELNNCSMSFAVLRREDTFRFLSAYIKKVDKTSREEPPKDIVTNTSSGDLKQLRRKQSTLQKRISTLNNETLIEEKEQQAASLS